MALNFQTDLGGGSKNTTSTKAPIINASNPFQAMSQALANSKVQTTTTTPKTTPKTTPATSGSTSVLRNTTPTNNTIQSVILPTNTSAIKNAPSVPTTQKVLSGTYGNGTGSNVQQVISNAMNGVEKNGAVSDNSYSKTLYDNISNAMKNIVQQTPSSVIVNPEIPNSVIKDIYGDTPNPSNNETNENNVVEEEVGNGSQYGDYGYGSKGSGKGVEGEGGGSQSDILSYLRSLSEDNLQNIINSILARLTATKGAYNNQIDDVNAQMDEEKNASEVERYRNSRRMRTSLANKGQLDSGLGRFESLYNNINSGNRVADIESRRNSMVNEIRNLITQAEAQANSDISSAQNSIAQQLINLASLEL